MADTEVRNARVKIGGRIIKVYKHKHRLTWIDYEDCKTEYESHQLEFLNG